jgi:hypothetical protein
VAALLAADHARLGKGQSAHVHHYRRIKGEDQAEKMSEVCAVPSGLAS